MTAPRTPAAGGAAPGWYYFGCHDGKGHYLFDRSLRNVYGYPKHPNLVFDGTLCLPEHEGLYLASLTRLGGLGYSALAFWDRTVDQRGKSNSAVFAPSLTCSPETIMRGAERFFPTVFARWPAINLTRANEQCAAMARAAGISAREVAP